MSPDLAQHLKPGDNVLVGQAVAEPPQLVRQLVAAAATVPDLTAYCGYTLSSGWDDVQPGTLRVRGFIAHGGLRRLAARGLLDVIPWHLSTFETNLADGRLPIDVVLLQVGPKDDDGYYNLGGTVDYVINAVAGARAVVVEVNDHMPRTRSAYRLHESQVTAAVATDAPLVGSPARAASDVERAVADHVAALVTDGGCLQVGLGPLADEIVVRLAGRRGLHVRAGVAGDWLVDLYDAGVMAEGPASSVISMAVGTRRLYDFVDDNDAVRFGPTSALVDPAGVAADGPLFAVNSAIEVDLSGQVNAEVVGGRYVGGIGGQVDFLRAARIHPEGLGIIAMASTHASGESRIVPALTGPVTTARTDIDLIVTEHGVADLRAASLAERARRLIGVAAPEHRAALADALRA